MCKGSIAHTHTRLTALCPGLPGWASTRKVKPISILLKQQTVSGSGISWAMCKSAPRYRQITTSAPHHSVFYRPDALPATQPTASKHWRQKRFYSSACKIRSHVSVYLLMYLFMHQVARLFRRSFDVHCNWRITPVHLGECFGEQMT